MISRRFSPMFIADCSGLLGRTSLRQNCWRLPSVNIAQLFRPSRPDFIETATSPYRHRCRWRHCSGLLGRTSLRPQFASAKDWVWQDCSGLLGRTSLRPSYESETAHATGRRLFRPSRPDFIETARTYPQPRTRTHNCSGLLGRTSLRPPATQPWDPPHPGLFRPSRPDFIETPWPASQDLCSEGLFRPSRPDFIETRCSTAGHATGTSIVPAF